jgi:large subunit ribosomal protein L14e
VLPQLFSCVKSKIAGLFNYSFYVSLISLFYYLVYWRLNEVPAIEIGRICVKQFGREQGKKCVIIDVMDKSFILITGPKKLSGVKRRRVNLNHVIPLEAKIEVNKGASDEEVTQVLEVTGKTELIKA